MLDAALQSLAAAIPAESPKNPTETRYLPVVIGDDPGVRTRSGGGPVAAPSW